MKERENEAAAENGETKSCGMSPDRAQAVRDEIAEGIPDELAQACEDTAAGIENAPTTKQKIAAGLRKIGTQVWAPPIHESRRPEVAAKLRHFRGVIENKNVSDAELETQFNNLCNDIRFGGFSIAIDRTPEALAAKENRQKSLHLTLKSLGWTLLEIAGAFGFARARKAEIESISWDSVVIGGEKIARQTIQLGCRPRSWVGSDEEWLTLNFRPIRPPQTRPREVDPNAWMTR
ncbi:MAG: hypothetical protein ACRETL_10945 [Gammaproteobacteria bacterium]